MKWSYIEASWLTRPMWDRQALSQGLTRPMWDRQALSQWLTRPMWDRQALSQGLTRPMWDRQAQSQLLQLNVLLEFDNIGLCFFHPDSFDFEGGGLTSVFKIGENIVDGEVPGVMVLSRDSSSVMVDVTGTKGFLVSPCHNGQWTVYYTVWSWVGNDFSCWRHVFSN